MYIQQVNQDGVSIALIRSEKPLMTDVQSALDLMMTVRAETGCKRIALNREAITGDFFVLSTGIAGASNSQFMAISRMKRVQHCRISSAKATKDGIFSSSPTQIRRRKSWHGRNEGDTAPSAKSNEKGRFGINTEPPFSCSNQHAEKVCKCAQLHRAKGSRAAPLGHPQLTRGRSM